jgi:hypothetical protein
LDEESVVRKLEEERVEKIYRRACEHLVASESREHVRLTLAKHDLKRKEHSAETFLGTALLGDRCKGTQTRRHEMKKLKEIFGAGLVGSKKLKKMVYVLIEFITSQSPDICIEHRA